MRLLSDEELDACLKLRAGDTEKPMKTLLNRLNAFEARRKTEIILVGFLLWLLLANLVLAYGWKSAARNVPNHPPIKSK